MLPTPSAGAASWVPVPEGSHFPLANLPYGVYSPRSDTSSSPATRIGVAIGSSVLDLGAAAQAMDLAEGVLLTGPLLDDFMAAGPGAWSAVRDALTEWLANPSHQAAIEPYLHPMDSVRMHLPFQVGDYVDFYASEYHATNAGRILRPNSEPLLPNWKHLPVGYHGRSGTVAVSDTPVVRPSGQRRPNPDEPPTFGPSQRLDIEAEVGFVVGVPSPIGHPVGVDQFDSHVFGVCLVNDWSARDIQAWEYVPLGPFLGKSFLTSISPWIVPLAALEAARVEPPPRDFEPLPYLRDDGQRWGLDLTLEVSLNGQPVSKPAFSTMYWTAPQQLAHMTCNGASVRTGDLYASGTVSGPEREQRGCFMELAWGGSEPFTTPDGVEHTYLVDGDEVAISATAPAVGGGTLGFGEVRGRVVASG
jgi:fumarylacetoacetase